MREAKAELFDFIGQAEFICITTNGTVKNNGCAVMGRGCALQAKTRWAGIDAHLGSLIRSGGNYPYYLGMLDRFKNWRKDCTVRFAQETALLSFPVKRSWNNMADINLIVQSAYVLKQRLIAWTNYTAVIPRPGCGNGGLNWEQHVRPALVNILDDRFLVITNEG
jgi:hypothetical protein